MSVLLVTVAIGKQFLSVYNYLFRRSQENYASEHKYDFLIVKDYLDPDHKDHHIATYFQKLLLCSQSWSSKYDYIIFVDSDILIRPNTPALSNAYQFEKRLGIVDEYSQPSKERRIEIQKMMGWEESATDYYKLSGFELDTEMVLNSGLLVMQPKYHKDFLEHIYNKYVPQSLNHPRMAHYEQSSVGYELQLNDNYLVLSNKWNAIWSIQKLHDSSCNLSRFYQQNYFIHFAGRTDFNLVPSLGSKVG